MARPSVSWAMLGLSACAARPTEILCAGAGQCPSSSGPRWRLSSRAGDAASGERVEMSGPGNLAFASLAARPQPPRRRACTRAHACKAIRHADALAYIDEAERLLHPLPHPAPLFAVGSGAVMRR